MQQSKCELRRAAIELSARRRFPTQQMLAGALQIVSVTTGVSRSSRRASLGAHWSLAKFVRNSTMLQDLRATLVQNHVRVIDLFRDWDEDESGRIDRTERAQPIVLLALGIKARSWAVHAVSWRGDGVERANASVWLAPTEPVEKARLDAAGTMSAAAASWRFESAAPGSIAACRQREAESGCCFDPANTPTAVKHWLLKSTHYTLGGPPPRAARRTRATAGRARRGRPRARRSPA